MAINMPHEGGQVLLDTCFRRDPGPTQLEYWMYTTPIASFDDSNTHTTEIVGNKLIDLASDTYNSCFDPASSTGYEYIALVDVNGDPIAPTNPGPLATAISVVGGVPQIELPEVKYIFTGALSGASSAVIHGYAVVAKLVGVNIRRILFREMFTTPHTPAAGTVLRFIATLRIGNTTCPLT